MTLDAAERVHRAARQAIEKQPADFEKALAVFERAVADDAEALREILAPYWKGAASVLLRREAAQLRSKAGQIARAAVAGSQSSNDTHGQSASVHGRRAGANSLAGLSIFDAFITELNRPLGDMTKEELIALRDRNVARSRLYDYLQAPLPPRGVVREHYSVDDVGGWVKAEMPYMLPVPA